LGILDARDYFNMWQKRKNDYIKNNMSDNLITTDDLNGIEKAKIIEVINDIKNENIQTTYSEFCIPLRLPAAESL
jgi:hypothetical protein